MRCVYVLAMTAQTIIPVLLFAGDSIRNNRSQHTLSNASYALHLDLFPRFAFYAQFLTSCTLPCTPLPYLVLFCIEVGDILYKPYANGVALSESVSNTIGNTIGGCIVYDFCMFGLENKINVKKLEMMEKRGVGSPHPHVLISPQRMETDNKKVKRETSTNKQQQLRAFPAIIFRDDA